VPLHASTRAVPPSGPSHARRDARERVGLRHTELIAVRGRKPVPDAATVSRSWAKGSAGVAALHRYLAIDRDAGPR
jgi:hypothetical protein